MLQNIEEALRRTPQDVLDARMQRHKRAMDLSLKHVSLPKDMQDQQTPFEYYLQVCLQAWAAGELTVMQLKRSAILSAHFCCCSTKTSLLDTALSLAH